MTPTAHDILNLLQQLPDQNLEGWDKLDKVTLQQRLDNLFAAQPELLDTLVDALEDKPLSFDISLSKGVMMHIQLPPGINKTEVEIHTCSALDCRYRWRHLYKGQSFTCLKNRQECPLQRELGQS
jgi:hypothetical protein